MRILAIAVVLCSQAPTVAQAGGQPPAKTLVVRCGELHDGTGKVLRDAVLTVIDGRIASVVTGVPSTAALADAIVLDASDKVVMPGIVAADTDLSGQADSPYNVTPDFVAADGFDFSRSFQRALAGGVTSAYLSPGRSRLLSGQGSVVKLHGDDLTRRLLKASSCLRVCLGSESTQAPRLFEPTPEPTAEDPLLPARLQAPTARISQLTTLRLVFDQAFGGRVRQGPGGAENQYTVEPLAQVTQGLLPLRVATRQAADTARALRFAQSVGATLVLEDPYEVDLIAADAARAKASAVLRIPVRPGAANPGGEDRKPKLPQNRPDNAAIAAASGLRIAIVPQASDDLGDILLVAAVAVRYGLTPEQAMRALTADAAAILGVGDRVGTLEAGKDADFLVLSGAPFAIGTLVKQAFVDGVAAYERDGTAEMLAIRARVIHTMAGGPLRDATVIVQDGKVRAVGEELAIPYGARLLDLRDAVITPGLIDAHSHAGLSGEGSGVPNGAADQRVADAVRGDDPALRLALEAGLTTVLVAGEDAGLVSGRMAAVKTATAGGKTQVLAETCGLRFVHDAIEPDGIKPLADAVQAGRKYIETWRAYDQAIAGGGPPPTPKPAEPPADQVPPDPITGTWELELLEPPPVPLTIRLELKLEGQIVTGELLVKINDSDRPPVKLENGRFESDQLTIRVRMPMVGDGDLRATVGQDTLEGTIDGRQTVRFKGTRTAKPGGTITAAGNPAEPTKPRFDEALEPVKALIEKRVPAVVRCNRGPAIAAVVKWFEEQQLPYVLTGLDDAVLNPEVLGTARPPVVLGPNVLRRERGVVHNAGAVFADRGHRIAFATSDTAGSRWLPVHAALAVRYGMDPSAALAALTVDAARMFKLDDRIGSLERGKDADLVVWSGNPLELTSRILLVVVNGRIVVDRR